MQRRVEFGMQHYLILMFIFFWINALRKMVKFTIYWPSLCLVLFWMLHFSISILTTISWCYNDYKPILQLNKRKIEKLSNLTQVIQWESFLLTWVVWEDTMEEVSLLNFHWFGPIDVEGGFPGKENGLRKGTEIEKGYGDLKKMNIPEWMEYTGHFGQN